MRKIKLVISLFKTSSRQKNIWLLFAFILFAIVISAQSGQTNTTNIVIYPVEYDFVDNGMVSGKADGNDLPFEYQHTYRSESTPYKDHKGNYARFAADGPVEIELTVNAEITKAVLHSIRRELPFTRDKSEFRFTLPGPGHYWLDLPDLYSPREITYMVHFFVDSIQTYQSYQDEFAEAADVTKSCGIISDPNLDQTTAIQQALMNNRIVYFPKGIYRTGAIKIPANTTLLLGEGSVIKGAEGYDKSPFISIDRAPHVRIAGLGTIDVYAKDRKTRKIHGIDFDNDSDYGVLEDFLIRDSQSWMVHIKRSSHVYINNLKIFSSKDGIDPDGTINTLIENCSIASIDDAVAVKSKREGYVTKNVTVRDCIVMSAASNLKIGTENYFGVIENIVFDNIKILNGDRGAILYTNELEPDEPGADVINITWRNIYIKNFDWRKETGGAPFQIEHRRTTEDRYKIENITFENILAWPKTGGDVDGPIRSVRFNNIIMYGRSYMPYNSNITYEGVIWENAPGDPQDIPVVFIQPSPRAHSRYVPGDDVAIDVKHPFEKSIKKVELFIDDCSVGIDTDAPFSIKISDVTLGEHIVKATATDSDGGQNTTAPLRVQVVESTEYFNTEGLGDNNTNVQIPSGRSPQNNQLLSIYPNPFNPLATVYYKVPNKQHVNIQIYNLRGQYIATLVDKQHIAGKYSVIFKGDQLLSGIYFCKMKIQDNVFIKKISLIK